MTRLMTATAVSLALLTGGCAQVLAQMAPTISTDLKAIPAGTYQLDNSHTAVLFELSHLGFSGYIGRFDTVAGSFSFDPAKPDASMVTITIDPASVDTNSTALEEKLRGTEGFNVAAHPAITFTSTRLTRQNERQGTLEGTLTMLGVTKPVTLAVEFQGGGKSPFGGAHVLGFHASGKFKRSEWGLRSWLPVVGDEVTLTIRAEFQRRG
jgi:polyisoprenoid-binding protein YceI